MMNALNQDADCVCPILNLLLNHRQSLLFVGDLRENRVIMIEWLFGKLLLVGSKAPEFSMIDQNSTTHSLGQYAGEKNLILVFYPADFTPGCTTQLCQFRDSYDDLRERDIEVFGINPQNWETHHKFAERYNLSFPILFDPLGKHAKHYKASLIQGFVNKRAVYGVNKEGIITFAQYGMPSIESVAASF